ncbi:hypothetical protein ACF5W4_17355 [Bacillota bacterium Lsc_1132]
MITRYKSALNKIKAEDELVNKTEMYLREALVNNQNPKFIKWRLVPMKVKIAIAAFLVVLLIGGSGGAYAYYQTPVSYLSLDINPSVELGINAFGKVVKADGYNNDGKKILNGINVTGSNVTKAVSTLITSAIHNGYVAKDGSTVVSLTSETDNKNTATKLQKDAETGAYDALKENKQNAVINEDNVALAQRKEANSLGITAGKLNLIKKLQAVDPTATVEQYKDTSVKEIMKVIQNKTDNGAVKNKDEGQVNNVDNGAVNNKDEGHVNNVDNGAVKNKDEGHVNNVDNGAVNNKNESHINNTDNGAVNNKNESVSESKKQTIDKANINNTNSVKNNNPSNGSSNSNNSGNSSHGGNNNDSGNNGDNNGNQ